MTASSLTIMLPLKGRHLHTLRFLWDANRRKLPYRFLILDGEVDPTIAGLLEEPSKAFSDLDIEYVRYPDDASFSDFYRKMADASARVRTKYVMQADNDDFLIPSGIDRCLEFLDSNLDYASYGAGVGAFAVAPTDGPLNFVTGPLDKLAPRYSPGYWPSDMSSSQALERCTKGFRSVIYYSVIRAPALSIVLRELEECNFSDLEIHEAFFMQRVLTFGKSGQDSRVMAYMRQMGTSFGGAWQGGDDWVDHLLKSKFSSDFETFVRIISSAISKADGIDTSTASDQIRDLYATKLRADLDARYPPPLKERPRYHPVRITKAVMSALGLMNLYYLERARRDADPRRRAARVESERRELFSTMAKMGASAGDVSAFSEDFAGIENGLRSGDFEAFVSDIAPSLAVRGSSQP